MQTVWGLLQAKSLSHMSMPCCCSEVEVQQLQSCQHPRPTFLDGLEGRHALFPLLLPLLRPMAAAAVAGLCLVPAGPAHSSTIGQCGGCATSTEIANQPATSMA
jgi:hypothetical protein